MISTEALEQSHMTMGGVCVCGMQQGCCPLVGFALRSGHLKPGSSIVSCSLYLGVWVPRGLYRRMTISGRKTAQAFGEGFLAEVSSEESV